jgi:hypothetical protein
VKDVVAIARKEKKAREVNSLAKSLKKITTVTVS